MHARWHPTLYGPTSSTDQDFREKPFAARCLAVSLVKNHGTTIRTYREHVKRNAVRFNVDKQHTLRILIVWLKEIRFPPLRPQASVVGADKRPRMEAMPSTDPRLSLSISPASQATRPFTCTSTHNGHNPSDRAWRDAGSVHGNKVHRRDAEGRGEVRRGVQGDGIGKKHTLSIHSQPCVGRSSAPVGCPLSEGHAIHWCNSFAIYTCSLTIC